MNRLLTLCLIVAAAPALADEGMWTPGQLPDLAETLEARGLAIDPTSMTDLTDHPMKAIVSLGGCTASFVSPEGLVVTNHHCAYGSISHNSTEARNLLRDGFVPATQADELPARPGSRVLVTVEVRDVTDRVLGELPNGLDGRARYQAIEDAEKSLVKACEEDAGHRCRVASYHGGLEYELIKQLEIRDVRLAYAPPESVGKYGGDIDNWMWPRHTGDYAFYRAYVGPDGKPADPAEDNVPYRPDHWLKVQPAGVAAGDFVMVAGYPGRTNRYRLADEVANVIEWYYPEYRRVYGAVLSTLEAAVADDEDAALKYASTLAGLNNATKNWGGMLEGFSKGDLVARKRALEADLEGWIASDPARLERYGAVLGELGELVDENQATQERDLHYRLARQSALLSAARTLYRLAKEREKPDAQREPGYQERDLVRIRERLDRIDRTFDAEVEHQVWRHNLLAYAAMDPSQHVEALDNWFDIQGHTVDVGAIDDTLEGMYVATTLDDAQTRRDAMSLSAAELEASEDPFLRLAISLYTTDMAMEETDKALTGRFQEARPQFMEALLAFERTRGKPVYPDANSTLRVTYGDVKGSEPRDGMRYVPFTTLEGIVQKYTGEDPFDHPAVLLDAMRESRYGDHAMEAVGSVPVNFLSTVDTTGGNSGSPTLNGRAELVGLLFDGTWESIIADWDFLPEQTRSIHVDIRYVLWSMEQLGGAERLLGEMGVGD